MMSQSYEDEDPYDPPGMFQSWKEAGKAALCWLVLLAIIALLLLGIFGVVQKARAHVDGHPEWNAVLGSSTNQQNGSCCGLGDVHLLDYDEWRESKEGYEVFIENQWLRVQKWQITTNQPNPTGRAIVWYSHYNEKGHQETAVFCFKPLNTY